MTQVATDPTEPDAKTIASTRNRLRAVASRIASTKQRRAGLHDDRARLYAVLLVPGEDGSRGDQRKDIAALAGLKGDEAIAFAIKPRVPSEMLQKGAKLPDLARALVPDPPTAEQKADARRLVPQLSNRIRRLDRHLQDLCEQRAELFRDLLAAGLTQQEVADIAGVTIMVVSNSQTEP